MDQDRLASKLTLFHNDIKNLIERKARRKPLANVGKSEIEGIELEASYDSTYLFSRAAYTMMRGKNRKTGQSLNSIPADELVLNIGGRVPDHDVTLGWRGVFANEQRRVSGRTKPSDGYAVHDVYASWIPKEAGVKNLQAFEVRAGVDNVFNRDYKEHLAGDRGKGRTYKLSVVTQF